MLNNSIYGTDDIHPAEAAEVTCLVAMCWLSCVLTCC